MYIRIDQSNCGGSKTFAQGLYADACLAGATGLYSKYFFTQGR